MEERATITTQADAIIYFLQRMDIEMVSDILSNEFTYQEFPKDVFVSKLGVALDEFNQAGDTALVVRKGSCGSKECNYKCGGYSFIGNLSKYYIDMIIDERDGEVRDMYECSDFVNSWMDVEKRQRIRIDRFEI